MAGFVYILASQKNGTLYTGVTSDLAARIAQHKCGEGSKFTAKYGVKRLVWYEEHLDIRDAIECEKRIKHWRRTWKVALIEKENSEWAELSSDIGHD
ncbi:MAG: GIY-YIG nuclease family protein [Pseudomonadota bacterium]